MSAIPPSSIGSIIQGHGSQDRVTEAKQAENARQTERTSGGGFSDKLQDIIESSDRDASVYSDAEGSGSQGSPFAEPNEDDALEPDDEEPEPGMGGRLDLEA